MFFDKAKPQKGKEAGTSEQNEEIDAAQLFESLIYKSFPFPYLVLKHNKIIMAHGIFKSRFDSGELTRIQDIAPNYDSQLSKQTAVIGEKTYALFTKSFQAEPQSELTDLSTVCFVETDMYAQTLADGAEKVIPSLIFIDNYEEVLESMEDVRRPSLIALIDRKINTLAQQVGGIIKKFEKDKYIFIFTFDKLEYLKEKKFDILTQIREIDMGNKIPVTLSIGIGINGHSLAENMEYSRAAMDLALGRGGDQVLIKDVDKYSFFGGVSREISVNARVRARVKSYAFAELVEESDQVIVLGHRHIDVDCLGAAVGVYKIVSAMGRDCSIVLGEITTNVKYLHQRLMQESEYRDKVLITAEQAAKKITKKTLFVVTDTHRPTMIEGREILDNLPSKRVVVFDHHRKATEFVNNAVLVYHEPYASSTCELITEMLQYTKGEVKLKGVEADALLAGITIDTKNFAIKTGARTFEAAAYLKRNGADSVRVKMLFQNDLVSFRAKAAAVNSAEIINDNMAVSVSPSNVENPQLTAAQAADELLNIHGVQASFVLCLSGNDIFISARSLGAINVQMIMEKMGGGGHQTIAGAQFKDKTMDDLEEVEEILRNAIDEYLREV